MSIKYAIILIDERVAKKMLQRCLYEKKFGLEKLKKRIN